MLDSTKPYCGFNNIDELNAHVEGVFAECIEVPNDLLPEKYHDKIRGGRTLARLNELIAEEEETETAHQKAKAAKARNIEKLRKQFEEKAIYTTHKGGTDFVDMESGFDYGENEADEIQLAKNEYAFVRGMVNGGLIEWDDLETE
ncbi:MAG: hypothetical protein FI729_00640 [SAR202 cluster bacterium]|nr:hypothetical protein [SAR202 cluster bacterium]|tara:strand:+ start:899 stop:1333 length:435 start_codon:yes stop_codon:yes gene_type:complete